MLPRKADMLGTHDRLSKSMHISPTELGVWMEILGVGFSSYFWIFALELSSPFGSSCLAFQNRHQSQLVFPNSTNQYGKDLLRHQGYWYNRSYFLLMALSTEPEAVLKMMVCFATSILAANATDRFFHANHRYLGVLCLQYTWCQDKYLPINTAKYQA